jgi:hypothetical protein
MNNNFCDPILVVIRCENSGIYGRMTVQYDNNCMNQRRVYEMVERFEACKTSVARPKTVTYVEVKNRIGKCNNQRVGACI